MTPTNNISIKKFSKLKYFDKTGFKRQNTKIFTTLVDNKVKDLLHVIK